MAAVAFARDMVEDEGETEAAWRLLDNRRQWLMATLSADESCQLGECRAEHQRWERRRSKRSTPGRVGIDGSGAYGSCEVACSDHGLRHMGNLGLP